MGITVFADPSIDRIRQRTVTLTRTRRLFALPHRSAQAVSPQWYTLALFAIFLIFQIWHRTRGWTARVNQLLQWRRARCLLQSRRRHLLQRLWHRFGTAWFFFKCVPQSHTIQRAPAVSTTKGRCTRCLKTDRALEPHPLIGVGICSSCLSTYTTNTDENRILSDAHEVSFVVVDCLMCACVRQMCSFAVCGAASARAATRGFCAQERGADERCAPAASATISTLFDTQSLKMPSPRSCVSSAIPLLWPPCGCRRHLRTKKGETAW